MALIVQLNRFFFPFLFFLYCAFLCLEIFILDMSNTIHIGQRHTFEWMNSSYALDLCCCSWKLKKIAENALYIIRSVGEFSQACEFEKRRKLKKPLKTKKAVYKKRSSNSPIHLLISNTHFFLVIGFMMLSCSFQLSIWFCRLFANTIAEKLK